MAFGITTFAHGGATASAAPPATGAFNAVAGNLIVVAVSEFNPLVLSAPPSDTAGNVYTLIGSSPVSPSASDGLVNIWFYYANNILGNAANKVQMVLTGAGNSSYGQIVAWQISGAASSAAAINTFKIGGNTTGGNAQSTAALSTSVANSIVLACGAALNLSTVYTAGSGYTIDMASDDAGGLYGCEHQQFSSIQSGIIPTITSNAASTASWQMMAIAIAAGSGGSGGGPGTGQPLGWGYVRGDH
jgi:hypothetical protein